jgi:hypothetical protein
MRRFTWMMSAFSKKFENCRHAIVPYLFFYNFSVHMALDVELTRAA